MSTLIARYRACATEVIDAPPALDIASAPALRDLAACLAAAGCRRLVVNLAPTEFADCAGLSGLVSARNGMRAHGGQFAVAAPTRRVRRLLALTGLHETLRAAPTTAAALAAMTAPEKQGAR